MNRQARWAHAYQALQAHDRVTAIDRRLEIELQNLDVVRRFVERAALPFSKHNPKVSFLPAVEPLEQARLGLRDVIEHLEIALPARERIEARLAEIKREAGQ